MRYRLSVPVLLFAVLAAAVLAAPMFGQERKGTDYPSEYFPLKVGASTLYISGDGKDRSTVRVEKAEPVRWMIKEKSEWVLGYALKTTSGDKSLIEDVLVAPDGVYRRSAGGKEIKPPIKILKLPPTAGDTWTVDSDSETVRLTGSFSVDKATITLPGRGETETFVVSAVDFYAGKERIESKTWFAKNLGIVKQSVKVSKFELNIELASPTTPAPPPPGATTKIDPKAFPSAPPPIVAPPTGSVPPPPPTPPGLPKLPEIPRRLHRNDAMAEFDYIRWLRTQVRTTDRVEVGIGDDCAQIAIPEEKVLLTTDMLLDGVHFRLDEAGPRRVGRKALAVNLSDIAAMAGRPVAALVSLALPRHGAGKLAEELLLGMQPLADEFATAIVGGDTNTWPGPLVISITVAGEPGPAGPVLRSGAKPGDWLFVTGPLGGSRGTREFDFTPRIQEARALALLCNLHAMIDISDGLAGDLGHLCNESNCGAVLIAERIPIAAAVTGQDPLGHALTDGEDFELAFAVSPEDGRMLLARQPVPGVTVVHVGEFLAERGLFLDRGTRRRPLEARGYVHGFE